MSRSSGREGSRSGREGSRSAPEGSSRSSRDRSPTEPTPGDCRGGTQPIAALVAVLAVCAAISTYSVVLSGTLPSPAARDRGIAKPTLERATAAVQEGAAVVPERLDRGRQAGPDGYHVRVRLSAADRVWTAGPQPPADAETAARPVSVRLAPAEVVTGRLRVEVWT